MNIAEILLKTDSGYPFGTNEKKQGCEKIPSVCLPYNRTGFAEVNFCADIPDADAAHNYF
jgi:hypothetical protein